MSETPFTPEDIPYMQKAIDLAARDERKFHVGAVIVKDGEELAAAHGDKALKKYAELRAIEEANKECQRTGKSFAGATLYTTLEPCLPAVRDPGTTPCAIAVITSGIGRVVIGVRDPNPNVTGIGMQTLKRPGIEVTLCTDNELLKRIERTQNAFRLNVARAEIFRVQGVLRPW